MNSDILLRGGGSVLLCGFLHLADILNNRRGHKTWLSRCPSVPDADLFASSLHTLVHILYLAYLSIILLLAEGESFDRLAYLAHSSNDSLKIRIVQAHILEAASDEFSNGDHLFDLQACYCITEAVELENAVWFAIMPDHWHNYEVGDVFVSLEVVRRRVKVRLCHTLEIVVVDRLGLAE